MIMNKVAEAKRDLIISVIAPFPVPFSKVKVSLTFVVFKSASCSYLSSNTEGASHLLWGGGVTWKLVMVTIITLRTLHYVSESSTTPGNLISVFSESTCLRVLLVMVSLGLKR